MTISKQEIIEAFWFRHACKEFDATRKIPDAEFEIIIEAARLSPSSFGLEPWKFLIVQNPFLREKLRTHTWGGQKQLPTASHVILTLVRKQDAMRYDSNYIRQLMREVQHYSEQDAQLRTAILEKFQRDDYGLLASPAALNAWSARQTYLPLANMMTVAALMGIDSCPIEGFDKPNLAALLSNEFSIPFAEWEPAYLLTLGCRKADPVRAKTRQESHLVVDWFI